MILHSEINNKELLRLIKQKTICFAGNSKLKIYGTLHCSSGKRMNKANRIFFNTIDEALKNNYRPCGHCMRQEYKLWKNGSIQ